MIGVYDSGYGGLTILSALRSALPHYDFVYLGDSGRAPYGGRDVHAVLDFAEQCVQRLFEEGCDLVIVACHTVSCTALRHLQRMYAPCPDSPRRVLGVTIPTAEAAVARTHGQIGVIGTQRTIDSGTFITEIGKLGAHHVTAHAAPLLAPIVEQGWEQSEIARMAVARYVERFSEIDTLVLACTHYPLLIDAFRSAVSNSVDILDPSPFVAERLSDWLQRHPGFVTPGNGRLRVLCTGRPDVFREVGRRFLGCELPMVEHVTEERGRLLHREDVSVIQGQFVR